jgi:diguanylate cyclase (GGDEF)-like protein/PAS domain S-box-containing protein
MRKKNLQDSGTVSANWLHVLGLAELDGAEWGRVRGAQITAVRRFALARLFVSVFAAIGIFLALRGKFAGYQLITWFGSATVLALALAVPQLRQREFPRMTATRGELHGESLSLFAASLCWAAPLFLFGPKVGPFEVLLLWAVTSSLMAGVSFTLARAPLAAALFIAIVGSALTHMVSHVGSPMITMVTAVYSAALLVGTLDNGRDFAKHVYAELTLKEKNEMVSLLLREHEDSGGDLMWQTDAARCLTHVSPRLAEALGVQTDQLNKKLILQILAGDKWQAGNFPVGLRDLADKLIARQTFSDLVVPVQINGETHWWEISAAPRLDENGTFTGFRGVASDVTDRRRSADKINRMARFDTLTGLPNRLQITDATEEALVAADHWKRRCGFLMLDLDRFKAVNDTLGHLVGDRLLIQVAKRLQAVMTPNEMCGRLGGDEFAVVIEDVKSIGDMESFAQRIIQTLSQPYEIDQNTLYIGASIGGAIGPRDGRTVETLIRSADLALYRSKDVGGGSFNIYEPQLHTHAEERRVLEIALRKALDKNEFQLHYQPVVNARSGVIESFEALLRWNNPELGSVSPAKFIPIAEEARLIRPIGEWALRTACKEAALWPSDIRIAVNVSAEQLLDSSFVSTVLSALSQAGLSPQRLELEVTESLFMSEGTQAVAVLEKILALGVRLALDDFGTGYSSLGYLSKTKFSTIKVDRSFVQGAAKKLPESIAIIRAVVALADSLGMVTTAEGVETEAELHMINELGCRKIQGYLFGRPMPAVDARALANRGTCEAAAA